jgi:hypothetical protein
LPDARSYLLHAATDLLAAGDSHQGVADLASAYADDPSGVLDGIVERVADELELHGALSNDIEATASRRFCRLVLDGHMSERDFARWAYEQFLNQSESELINRLAYLDDDYYLFEGSRTKPDSLDLRVREIARDLLNSA